MGGFAGGDEAGFWDIDTITESFEKSFNNSKNENSTKLSIEKKGSIYTIKAYAKVSIFLKLSAKEGLFARFMKIEYLYDTISFVPSTCKTFKIEGCEDIPLESNTIYKAYQAICDYTNDSDIIDFFQEYKVVVDKKIPKYSGLGASSSNAAAFLCLVKEVCNLILTNKELVDIGKDIGTAVAFFIYNYPVANISGSGETVEAFIEEPLRFELFNSSIKQDVGDIYQKEDRGLMTLVTSPSYKGWKELDSRTILQTVSNPALLNDFYAIYLKRYSHLKKDLMDGYFFSGYTFFKPID